MAFGSTRTYQYLATKNPCYHAHWATQEGASPFLPLNLSLPLNQILIAVVLRLHQAFCPTYAVDGEKASPLLLKLIKKNILQSWPFLPIYTSSWSCYIAKLPRRNVEIYSGTVILQRLTGSSLGGSLSKKESHLLTRLFDHSRKDRNRAFPRHGKSTLTSKEYNIPNSHIKDSWRGLYPFPRGKAD